MPMWSYGGMSIGRKLSATVMTAVGLALLLACSAFVAHDVTTFRETLVRKASVLAEIVGINSTAALTFSDAETGNEILGALSADKRVLAAAIYDRNGAAFVQYRREGTPSTLRLPDHPGSGYRFGDGELILFHEIQNNGETIGTAVVMYDTSEIQDRLWRFLQIVALVMAATSAVGWLVARRLQGHVARPLAELVRGSQAAAEGNLGVRVPVESDDEFGKLAGSFNDMSARLREVISQVRGNIRAVAEVSETLEQGSRRVSSSARKQETAVEAAAESVESVVVSVEKVNDSVGELAATATETSSSMLELDASVAEVAANMDRLAESIESSSASIMEIANSIEQVSSSIERLNEVTAMTESSIHELHASVQQVEGNAKRSRELSDTARSDAERGRLSVQQTTAAMGEIKTAFGDLEQAISRLADKSDSIGAIVKVIEEVAEETSLLSLNAAIIASQAGEHGKAFAVVAGAVKELAERTARSTREIAGLVESVQAETKIAVSAMAQGAQRVDRGVTQSREAGESLRGIIESAELSVRMVNEIGQATDQQARDLAQVDRAVLQVRQSVEDVTRAIADQKASSGEIRRGVDHIRTLGQEVKRSTQEQSRGTKLITVAVEKVTGMVQDMMRATREQTKGSEQIRTALQVFREVTEETTRTAEEIQASVDTLASRSTQLEQEMGRFKI
jgi:methyl-accepting chemotaxis protein